METTVYTEALTALHSVLTQSDNDQEIKQTIENKGGVLERFQPIFSPDQVSEIKEHEFQSFLLYQNNKHWTRSDITWLNPGRKSTVLSLPAKQMRRCDTR